MNTDVNTVRLLGVAQVLVFVGTMITGGFLISVVGSFGPAVGSGRISAILVRISEKTKRMRISNLVALGESLAIVAMGVLYYVVFYKEYQAIALMALGCFLVAAIILTVTKIGTNALIPLSQKFVEAGAPEASHFQTLGDFLYNGVDQRGFELMVVFNSLGFLLANYLLYVSGSIPHALSIWGLVAVILALIPGLLQLYQRDIFPRTQLLALPFAPY
jgi:prepilin signal peptidase PulO-like enzyme (type II secretory pathway)